MISLSPPSTRGGLNSPAFIKWLSELWEYVTASPKRGIGSPETFVNGSIGDVYVDTEGTPGAVLYVKESGTNTNVGWSPK